MSSVIPFFVQKLVSTVALLMITAIFSYLPFLIKSRVRKAGLIMSYCNCLAGGIVLGAMLMHMIPEIMEGAAGCSGGHSHAIAPALVKPAAAAGLFTLPDLPVAKHNGDGHSHKHEKKKDKSAKAAKADKHDHDHDQGHSHAHSHDDGHSHGFAWGPFFAGVSFLVLFAVDRLFLTHSHCSDAHPQKMTEAKKLADVQDHDEHDHEHHHHHGHDCHGHLHHHAELSLQPDAEHGSCHEDDVIGGCHMDGINSSSTQAQTFVFVVALSIHSFLEGLGMSSKSTWNSLLSFMISLFAHKWLEAFALGTSVAKACFSPLHAFLLIAVYALLTPAGILLGMAMDTWSQSTSALAVQITRQVLDGLALGSFLFVSCIEMIPSEFHKQNKHSPFKFSILCLGFLAMAAISTLHFH